MRLDVYYCPKCDRTISKDRVEQVDSGQRMVAFQVGRMQFGKRELVEGVSADSTAPMR